MGSVLAIIPAFNEEQNIEMVVEGLSRQHPQIDYVVINDGSTDGTARICQEKGYNLLDLPVNLGLAGCFQAGMKYAYKKEYQYVVQFDGDGQHRPEYIAAMKARFPEGYDIVIGSRFLRVKKNGSLRMWGSMLLEYAIRLTTGAVIRDPTSGMRMFNRNMIEAFVKNQNYGPEPDTISWLIKQGARVVEEPVVMDERAGGVSYLTPLNAVRYMVQMLISILFIRNFRG